MAVLTSKFCTVKLIERFPGPAASLVAGLGLVATELFGIYVQNKHASETMELSLEVKDIGTRMDVMTTTMHSVD